MPREKFMHTARWRDVMRESGLDALVVASPNGIFYATGALLPAQLKASPSLAARLVDDRPTFAIVRENGDSVLLVSSRDAASVRSETWADRVEVYDELDDNSIEHLGTLLRDMGLVGARLGLEHRYLTAAQMRPLSKLLGNTHVDACDEVLTKIRACLLYTSDAADE